MENCVHLVTGNKQRTVYYKRLTDKFQRGLWNLMAKGLGGLLSEILKPGKLGGVDVGEICMIICFRIPIHPPSWVAHLYFNAGICEFGIFELLSDGEDSVTQIMTVATIGYRWHQSLRRALRDVVDANLVTEEQAFSAKMNCLLSSMHSALDFCMESPEQQAYTKDAVEKLKKIIVQFLDA
ncbi:hypothetical protein CUMW_256600 [Citrus unshiu]|uniref:Uncharacterized protein n=1 Tax=Citrus unshiu TaxID=55188 RepID=A0A2H5QS58_CITUN|nr:hypothetical protein CUMW_256600 [Citrus unshiu]